MMSTSMSQDKPTVEQKMFGEPITDTSSHALRELLEKNLKWSHIIYEQNRRLHTKLMWSLVANWLRLTIIAVPIILGLWFFPGFLRKIKHQNFISTSTTSATFEGVIEKLPLSNGEKEGLSSLLK